MVYDRKPLLGEENLPKWLSDLAHSRAMVTVDGYADNLCVWRCIAIFNRARFDHCTKAAQQVAKRFFKTTNANDCAPVSLEQLREVEEF